PPPGAGLGVAPPGDLYNNGAVTTPPPGSPWYRNMWDQMTGVFTPCGGRAAFQSDHGFDNFASPVRNPFLAGDPASLTEVRPIFMHQGAPLGSVLAGGDVEYAGVQARLALTERLSIVMSELGFVWLETHNPTVIPENHFGFASVRIGPKYTFYRCEESGTVA